MGVLAGGPIRDSSKKTADKKTANTKVPSARSEAPESTPRSMKLRERISFLLSRFDVDDKESLATQLVEILELRSARILLEKSKKALGEDLTEVAEFRLGVLAQIAKDRDLTIAQDSFPDDFGSPKTGL